MIIEQCKLTFKGGIISYDVQSFAGGYTVATNGADTTKSQRVYASQPYALERARLWMRLEIDRLMRVQ